MGKKSTISKATLDKREPKASVKQASSAINGKGTPKANGNLDSRTPETSKNLADKAVQAKGGAFKNENNLDNRTPKDSVSDALKKVGVKLEPGLNGHIKDTVNAILNGDLINVMEDNDSFDDENDELMDEGELILGGNSSEDSEPPKEEDDIEMKLSEMGYGDDDSEMGVGDDVSLDLDETETEEPMYEVPAEGDELMDEDDLELDVDYDSVEETPEINDFNPEEESNFVEPGSQPDESLMDAETPEEDGGEDDFDIDFDVETMDYDDLNGDDQTDVDDYSKNAEEYTQNIMDELESIEESILPKERKDKLAIYFEMLAEEKAKILATKKVATVINSTNSYMEKVVKEFTESKSEEIKEAIESTKKNEIYENFQFMVEKLYGEKSTKIMEAKKVEDFLTNVISEMKNETDKLENVIKEQKRQNEELKCASIFNEATKKMIYTDKERIASFMETFDVANSGDFKTKLNVVIEQFGKLSTNKSASKPVTKKRTKNINEAKLTSAVKKNELLKEQVVKEDKNDEFAPVDPSMFDGNFFA